MALLGDEIRVMFAQGAAVLLAALVLGYLRGIVVETGDTYARLFGEFASKREMAVILLASTFGGPYIAGLFQEWLVTILLRPGYLEVGIGFAIWSIIILVNRQVKSWKPFNEGDPLFVIMAATGGLLVLAGFMEM